MSKPAALTSSHAAALAVTAASGVVFGFALEKGHVFSPQTIVGQMLMKDFTMLKMFLSAAATSMLAHGFISCTTRGSAAVDHLMCRKSDKGLIITALGASLLGAGMALAGSCPGTILAQIGSGQPNSLLIFTFGLVGAALYAFADRAQLFAPLNSKMMPKEDKVTKLFGINYVAATAVVSAMLAAGVVLLERQFPSHLPLVPTSLSARVWSPIAAGVVVGALQVPMLLATSKPIGSSYAFVTLTASIIDAISPGTVKSTKVLADAIGGFNNAIQPVYLVGAVAGAFLASYLSNSFRVPIGATLPSLYSALGGVLIIFGARIAGGCTSGHGISGFSLFGLRSITATAAMFAGGITSAFLVRSLAGYPTGI